MQTFLNDRNWPTLHSQFQSGEPFEHVVIDDFFRPEIAAGLAEEFPDYHSPVWNAHYANAIENKKACNIWDRFPSLTYRVFHFLCQEFCSIIQIITGASIQADVGLHGGGWHAHSRAGQLNLHLDYSLHPKLQLERRYNLIVYISPNWQNDWGGGLEFWTHGDDGRPKEKSKSVENKFNRAVLFDTTQNSWHGLPQGLSCPGNIMRQSLAVYYVAEPRPHANPRERALFSPREDQIHDHEVLELIKKRSL